MATLKASNVKLDVQSGSTRTVFATWTWSHAYTENYSVAWYYGTGDGVWFVGQDGTTEYKQSTYNAPENAIKVKFKVKPIPKEYKSGGKTKKRFTSSWSTEVILNLNNAIVATPPVPTVTLEGLNLIARVDNLDANCTQIQFQVVKNNTVNAIDKKINVNKLSASLSVAVQTGAEYKVRCRGVRNSVESEWTEYSSSVKTQPAAPDKITACRASSSTSVYLEWKKSNTAAAYEIQYTTKRTYFDSSSEVQSITTENADINYREITGLESGHEYFFRVRSVNDNGSSGWTEIKSVIIGREPAPPTTWSSKTTAKIGDELELYWVHNSEDGSKQTQARIEIDIGDGNPKLYDIFNSQSTSRTKETANLYFDITPLGQPFSFTDGHILVVTFEHTKSDPNEVAYLRFNNNRSIIVQPTDCVWENHSRVTFVYNASTGFTVSHITKGNVDDETDGTFVYNIKTSNYTDGTKLKWKVATKGIRNDFSSFSVQRIIELYSAPSVELQCFNSLTAYPYSITATVGPNTQTPIGYHLSVTALTSYPTVNEVGQTVYVTEGAEVFSRYFDTSINPLKVELLPGNVKLENNVPYKITCTVATNAGLTAIDDAQFTVYLADTDVIINAEIGIDPTDLSAVIRPYCMDEHGIEVINNDILFSVYRREYDGAFTIIGKNRRQSENLIDLHPALDYARYRIVATSQSTGRIEYYDVPGEPVGESAAVIQWNEQWHPFDTTEESSLEQPTSTSTMVKLPYNLDVSDSNSIDVSHINYIGRRHPVAYYGTHVGETSTWNVDIVKDDVETLYALRCLQKWMGDVYVREPSGSGYWATVAVSFSQKHKSVTIPVTINITRVEGGD